MRKFNDLKLEFIEKWNELQDIQTEMYGVKSYHYKLAPDQTTVTYNFVCFFNADNQQMGTTICDSSMTELKLLSDIPTDVMCAYGAFCLSVLRWQNGEIEEFPCAVEDTKQIALLDTLEPSQPCKSESIEDDYMLS